MDAHILPRQSYAPMTRGLTPRGSNLAAVLKTARKILGLDPGGGKVAKNVLNVLAIHADDTGYSWPSQNTLAACTGFTVRAIRKALADLEAEGLITRRARFRRDGTRDSDGIQLCLTRINAAQSEDETEDQRNPIPEDQPATTGIPHPVHRNPTAPPPESDSGLTTFEQTRERASEHSEPTGSAPQGGASPGFRKDLFDRGTRILARLTGRVDQGCRAVIGTWLKLTGDDEAAVMRAIDEAEAADPAEAVAWIEARLRHGRKTSASAPTATPAAPAVVAERQAQAEAMVARGQWPVGGRVFVAADSPAGDAWVAYYRARGVVPRWSDFRIGRGWHMPSALPPTPPPAALAA